MYRRLRIGILGRELPKDGFGYGRIANVHMYKSAMHTVLGPLCADIMPKAELVLWVRHNIPGILGSEESMGSNISVWNRNWEDCKRAHV